MARTFFACALITLCFFAIGCERIHSCDTKRQAAALAWENAGAGACEAARKSKEKMGMNDSGKSPWMPAAELYNLRDLAAQWTALCDSSLQIADAYRDDAAKNLVEIFSMEEKIRNQIEALKKGQTDEADFFLLSKKALDASMQAQATCRGR